MKELIAELRMWLAEILLGFAFDVAPDKEGHELKVAVTKYIASQLAKK